MTTNEREYQQRVKKCVDRIEAGENPADMVRAGDYDQGTVVDALELVVQRGAR